ncbi:MAG: ABC transporter permease [Betaproteobacteria bacterium]|nr:ABC transporter permease [Betaproteobacteria bacterium]NBT76134.1 ABC transporter permease [Betaproteobacteria bacterium]NCA16584.1 ABC transporter permease [Betaproteobacteria bacterium]
MTHFLLRRIGYGLLVLIGINLVTFLLFFKVNSPDDMARIQLGGKRITPEAIEKWKAERGYDRPLFWNDQAKGSAQLTDTLFVDHSLRMFALDFGRSDSGRDISSDIRTRAGPSLALALPTFVVGLGISITLALGLTFFRGTQLDLWGSMACVVLMSISALFFIVIGQFVLSRVLQVLPISGFESEDGAWRFLIMPIAVSLIARLGGETRFNRTLFLEEIGKDYVRTARAKGLSDVRVLFGHVLRNALIPIITSSVAVIPLLFMGSLIVESFFAIPGLGSYLIDAIAAQDFAIVRSMVFIGSALYILGLILTEICYALADPRIRLI